MPRAVWIILGVAASLVALLLIGVAIVIATVDPNRFVAPLAARVKAETGRNLVVQGPLDITLSLEPKVVLPGVALDNAPWSKTGKMLTAKRIEAQIALLPLLSRRFEVVQFTLIEPVIALETDANGRGNWEIGRAGAATGAAPSAASSSDGVSIANFEIRDGTLTYRNGATGKLTRAAIERMSLHARSMQSPVAIEFRGKVDDVAVSLAGDLGAPDQWLRRQEPYPVAVKGEVDGKAARLTTKIARSGTTTSLDDVDIAYGALAAKGSIRATSDGARTNYAINLAIASLALADLAANASPVSGNASAPAAAPGAAHAASTKWVVPDEPLPLAPLAALDAEGSITIGELILRDGQRLQQVAAQFTSRNAALDAKFTAGEMLGGSMRGELKVAPGRADAPGVHVVLDAQDLDLAALAAAAGIRRDIRGGKVRASVDVHGQGATPHRVASTMSGTILVTVGPAQLGRVTVQGESALSQLSGALDPLQSVDAATELRCAVLRLPLRDGIAHVDRSIAVETAKAGASASGTLNFRDETLDLSVQPQVREGVKVDISQFASLVRIQGRFDKPAVGIDAAQSAQMIAKIGVLGAAGGGLAAIGGALLSGSTGDSGAPCAIAMSGKAPAGSASSKSAQEAAPVRALPADVGKALGKLFGR